MKKTFLILGILIVVGVVYAQTSDYLMSLFIRQRIVMQPDATTSTQSSEIYFEVGTADQGEYIYSSADGQLDLVAATEVQIAATTIDLNGIVDMAGASTLAPYVLVTDGNYSILAANSGKLHLLPDGTATDTLTFPAEAVGLYYRFIYRGGAADGQNKQFTTGADVNFYIGGVEFLDSDGDVMSEVFSNGSSNSKFTMVTPSVGTDVEFLCDGTNWYIFGQVVSATTPAMAAQ